MIAEEWCNMEKQTGVNHGHSNARRVEYCAKMADIRVVHLCEGPTRSKPVDHETLDQQGQLDGLQSNRDFQKLALKCGQEQLECLSKDVHLTGENKRFVKLRNRAETGKLDKQAGKGSKKVLGLQEYWDCQEDKREAAEVARSATNPEEEEDWDTDVMPPPCSPAPGLEDLVSHLNQDPRTESITDSGIGTTAMEEDVKSNDVREDVKLNAVREESVEDETSCAILDHSSVGCQDSLSQNYK